jgi:hypothetical protein
MTDIELLAQRTSTTARTTLGRLGSLARGLAVTALLIAAATYATLLWVTDDSGWYVVGLLCFVPFLAGAVVAAPKAVDDLQTVLRDGRARMQMGPLIDHDSQQPLATLRSMSSVRRELNDRRKELPALFSTVTALVTVPGLAAIAVLGTLLVGLVGTILLIAGLVG